MKVKYFVQHTYPCETLLYILATRVKARQFAFRRQCVFSFASGFAASLWKRSSRQFRIKPVGGPLMERGLCSAVRFLWLRSCLRKARFFRACQCAFDRL
ncbi:hypothetical protein NDU88_005790 [Pleurodeles waltl]|uniref:Uncharacterized protein n=1 Tax=Pleurodeles waltl TaxID=8319 RepID=A0AAV7WZR1_PLEWA|nr:hypothetical protein NDU88_005790 [Pleurodeles waltl]